MRCLWWSAAAKHNRLPWTKSPVWREDGAGASGAANIVLVAGVGVGAAGVGLVGVWGEEHEPVRGQRVDGVAGIAVAASLS